MLFDIVGKWCTLSMLMIKIY